MAEVMFQNVAYRATVYRTGGLTIEQGPNICLVCPPKMMSFSQLPSVKKTSFLVGIQNKTKLGPSYLIRALGKDI